MTAMTAALALPHLANGEVALDPSLRAEMLRLVEDGVPANTRRAYEDVGGRFDTWCTENGRRSTPASMETVCAYLTSLTLPRPDGGAVKASTLQYVAWVISARQKALTGSPLAGDVLMAVGRLARGHAAQRRGDALSKAYPLVPDAIREIAHELDYNSLAGLRAGVILSLGYSTAARESEMVGWTIGDVTRATYGLNVHFWRSKTDQEARGVSRPVPAGHSELTDPVTRLDEYLAALESFGVDIRDTSLPLLRSLTSNGKPRPMTVRADGNGVLRRYGGLATRKFDDILRNICKIGKITQWEDVSGHSLRSGFASACAFARNPHIPVSIWERHGRWAPGSPEAAGYVQAVDIVSGNPLHAVGL